MPFMSTTEDTLGNTECRIWRSAIGEDGYEISCDAGNAEALARLSFP